MADTEALFVVYNDNDYNDLIELGGTLTAHSSNCSDHNDRRLYKWKPIGHGIVIMGVEAITGLKGIVRVKLLSLTYAMNID